VKAKSGVRVTRYTVAAPKGAHVTVTCSRGCRRTVVSGRGTQRVPVAGLRDRALANGTRITVTVSAPGSLTRTIVDRVAKGRLLAGRGTCTVPGAARQTVSC
jgi:hypothetical protein